VLAPQTNADGFGLAWYNNDSSQDYDCPAQFRSTTPAWSCLNLLELAQVRAAVWCCAVMCGLRARAVALPCTFVLAWRTAI
jgi:hypothetical protein